MQLGAMQDWPLRIMRILDHAEREHGVREIVSGRADGTTFRTSWSGIAGRARRLAKALDRAGVAKGDRVATLAMNHDRHLVSWFGAVGMGGVIHTINPRLFDDQLAYIANHAEDRILFYDRGFAPLVERLKPRFESIRDFICFDDEFDDWIAQADEDYAWVEGDERDPCGLCYTSGTTGNPKGVLYEHRSTVLHSMSVIAPDALDLSARSVMLPVVPMFHANSWCIPYASAIAGLKLVLCADNQPERLCGLFNSEQVTHSAGVPTVWLAMIEHCEQTGATFPSLDVVVIGGSAAPASVIGWFQDRGVRVNHLWGMTEMSPVGTVGAAPAGWDDMSPDEQIAYLLRPGRSMFGVELRTVDADGRTLPRDGASAGHLQARGAAVVKRYFRAGEDAVDGDNWFDTGDIAIIHPDGSIALTDRSKDVIKSGGEWISSIELENAAVGADGILEAAAIGLPHPKWGERPLLLLVRSPGSDADEESVLAYLSTRVSKWWLPDAMLFVDELPHTATGKLSKKDLRARYADFQLSSA
jgi:acyl-CoA synthetase (AMP-forming)/AMP-acid ligase II